MKNKYYDLIDQTFDFPVDEFRTEDGELYFHDIPLMEVIKQYGTPLKITYLPKISSQIQRAKRMFNVAIAKTELCCTLAEVVEAADWLLQTGGSLWIVHRPERVTDLFCALRRADLEPKLLRPVLPRPESAPSLLLLRAVRGGKPGLRWLAPLVLADSDGSASKEYLRIYHMEEL